MSAAAGRHGQAALSARARAGAVVRGEPGPRSCVQVAGTLFTSSRVTGGSECPVVGKDGQIECFVVSSILVTNDGGPRVCVAAS